MTAPTNFPKLESPFVRENDTDNNYVVTPELKPDYDWILDPNTHSIEKLDGTCGAILIENDEVTAAYTRLGNRELQQVKPFTNNGNHRYFTRGVQNSISRDYLKRLDDGIHFGELVGPAFGGGTSKIANPHQLDEHLFIPFKRALRKHEYRSWGEYEQSFDALSNWFQDGLFSQLYCLMNACSSDTARTEGYVEGIVFAKPGYTYRDTIETKAVTYEDNDGSIHTVQVATSLCKLRRDMFSWYWRDHLTPTHV